MQQYLPFTVLKLASIEGGITINRLVATVLTVYGIETINQSSGLYTQILQVATVLTVYGIETRIYSYKCMVIFRVATVLTVYGIET